MAKYLKLQRGGFFGLTAKKWEQENIAKTNEINQNNAYSFGITPTTIATVLGSSKKQARNRQGVYQKFEWMESDPIISTAIQLQVTAALGGHETTGDVVFIEKKPAILEDKKLSTLVDEINTALAPLFNKTAYTTAYNGGIFGDAYARIYTDNSGVIDLYIDEMVRPPLVQPFEKGSKTVGYAVYTGEKSFETLDVMQMARLKMPRTQFIPQVEVIQKSQRFGITIDDIEALPVMPCLAGGSFLFQAEEPYDNLSASLVSLVGQRLMDSIDEQLVGVNMSDMTTDQQKLFIGSITNMLKKSKQIAENAVKTNKPVMERIRHILPFWGEKQLVNLTPTSSGRSQITSIEDIMFQAQLLAGALGTDLSMLGFSNLLSGGLGDGGFFRVSAQVAQRSVLIRNALTDFFNHIIDIHCIKRYGSVFSEQERPWSINFYGSISALEAEKQRTRTESMNSGMLLVQAMQMSKDMGFNKDMMQSFLTKQMMLDEDQALLYAAIVEQAAAVQGEEA